MSTAWPRVKLGEVLQQRKEFITIDDLKRYKRARVQLHAKGIVLRDEVDGGTIKTKKQQICQAGEFLVAEIDAKVGGFGLVPAELAGAIVSSHYFLFQVNEIKLDRRFLDWFIRTHDFRDQVEAQGSTNYAAIRPADVLAYEMPLPPLAEQQRIVERIDDLARKIHQAHSLQKQACDETDALFNSAIDRLFTPTETWKTLSVGDFCDHPQYGYTESATDQAIGPRFLRITDIQNGKVDWGRVPYCSCSKPEKYLLKSGDLVFARTGATTGKSFVIEDCPEAVFASYLIRLRVLHTVSVSYLYYYFQTPSYWNQISDGIEGTGQPNLNGTKLKKLKVPVAPTLEQQRIVNKIIEIKANIDALRRTQADNQVELNALLPSVLKKAFRGEL